MGLIITSILGILVFSLYVFYRHRKNALNIFKTMGVPGPEPHWFFGNFHQVNTLNIQLTMIDWAKKYGKIFGYYEGSTPVLVISDPDMIQEVFVKQFSNFHGRKPFAIDGNPDTQKEIMMLKARGHRWKRLRSIVNPTFSTSKLKGLQPLITSKIDVLIEKLNKQAESDTSFNIVEYFQQLTLDIIGEAAFGLDINSQQNPQEELLLKSKQIFQMSNPANQPFLINLGIILPEIRPVLAEFVRIMVAKVASWPFFWLTRTIAEVVDVRREQKSSRKDLLQLMLDAEADEEDVKNVNMWEMKENDNVQNKTDEKKSRIVKLTNKEIEQNALLFFLAGYETTSNLLGYAAYLLALNPDKQSILQKEIDDKFNNDENDNLYAVAQSLEYLDLVVKEILRMYPIAAGVVNRMCMYDTIVNGIPIPEGMIVQSNGLVLHYDPEIWGPTDPNIFEPERFKTERHPAVWIPFGAGPRNCVGMRLALMEGKAALMRMMMEFSFVKSHDTQVPLELIDNATLCPKDGVFVKVVKRSK